MLVRTSIVREVGLLDAARFAHAFDHRAHVGRELLLRLLDAADRAFTPEELVDVVLDREPLFAPGGGYRYTDTGYILVGLVIEKATGRRYEDLLTERILVPLADGFEDGEEGRKRER